MWTTTTRPVLIPTRGPQRDKPNCLPTEREPLTNELRQTTMAATISPLSPTATASAVTPESSRFTLADTGQRVAVLALIGLCGLLTLGYWEVLQGTAREWSQPQYSHGWIIPLIGLYILWARRPKPEGVSASDRNTADLLRNACFALGGLAAVGYTTNIGWLAGFGLAGLCLAALTICLLGQPYAAATNESQPVNYTPLWAVTGVGTVIVGAGLLAFVGVRLPVLHPGYVQMLGLIFLLLGGLAAATFTELGPKAGLPEQVYAATLMLLSLGAWAFAVQVDMMPLARFSFVTALLSAFAMIGGLRLLKWAGPAVAFLVFMYPLPQVIEGSVLNVLQSIAVRGAEAVYTLTGVAVIREGNVLELQGVSEKISMEVIGACSGLAMSTILVAMAVALAMLINRPWWDKVVVLLSALPIALIANIFRIVATGFIWIIADQLFPVDAESTGPMRDMLHNYAGILLMMPFAIGMYWLEFKLLSMLTIEEAGVDTQAGSVLGRPGAIPPR